MTEPHLPTFKEARQIVEDRAAQVTPGTHEQVDLLAGAGRVLAQAVIADRDIPPFPRSTRDGYAVRSSDLRQVPAMLKVIGEIRAGERAENIPTRISADEVAAIMTGAPIPDGADAVVMVEYTSLDGKLVTVSRGVAAGENIVPRGAEARIGSTLIDRGVRLNEAAIGLAASAGCARLPVYRKARIAILTTGDEIVDISATPETTQIRNSNSYSLAEQVTNVGGDPVVLPIAPDEPIRLRELIEEGLRSDLLLMTGGVSMGRYDLVEQVLGEIGAEFFFTGAKIQPGRPVVFGRAREKFFFGLPGNPVSTMVTFELFARPMIEALMGMRPRELHFPQVRAKSEIRVKPGLMRFLPAIISGKYEDSRLELISWQGSGDIAATARANCYAVIDPERERIAPGEWVPVMMR